MVVVGFKGNFMGLDGFLISSQNVPTPNHSEASLPTQLWRNFSHMCQRLADHSLNIFTRAQKHFDGIQIQANPIIGAFLLQHTQI